MIRSPRLSAAVLLTGSLLSSLACAQGAPGGPGGPPPAMPTMAYTTYATALEVREGRLLVPAPGATATSAEGFALTSARDRLNGVFISGGHSAFTLNKASIHLSGMGQNDFLGIGAGVLVRDGAAMVVDHSDVTTAGTTASALVAAEGATLRVYDSHLMARGGPLPAGYVRHIGPGMMEPPAPLGLDGTARTLLAMSNSRVYIYRTTIEADGWGALSTDAAGDRLYVEANDSVLRVARRGYGTYADFGAHVVLNRTRVESGGEVGIIAGKARIDLNRVEGHAGRVGVMIHSVMGDPQEVAELTLAETNLATAGPVFLVNSANAAISVEGGQLTSASGTLLELRKNDDANATQTHGAVVPGVRLSVRKADLRGDLTNTDTDRALYLKLEGTRLQGALHPVVLSLDAASHWQATAASEVELAPGAALAGIDAGAGITIQATSADAALRGRAIALAGGGQLLVR